MPARVVYSGQITQTGAAIALTSALAATQKSRRARQVVFSIGATATAAQFVGPSGVTTGNGLRVAGAAATNPQPVSLFDVDLSAIFTIGTAADVLTFAALMDE